MSLGTRLVTFISVISLVTIATFAGLQLKNQMDNTTKQTVFQSKVNAITIKNNFEKFIKNVSTQDDLATGAQSIINTLVQSNIVTSLVITNPEGLIVAASNPGIINTRVPAEDLAGLKAMGETVKFKKEKWLFSQLDDINKQLNLFIPVPSKNGTFIIKTHYPTGSFMNAVTKTYKTIVQMVFVIGIINAILAFIIIKTVVSPIIQLNVATKAVAGGRLDSRVNITTGDEIQELSNTFNDMTEALQKMKKRAENANPLTKLPGNIVIHEEVDYRIDNNKLFTVIYSDLDNFKAFNDKYGIHAGDKAIMISSDIFKNAIKDLGDENDFLGHEGGDDFIILTTPEKAEAMAKHITDNFDKEIRGLYSQEDLDKGKIIAKDRQGNVTEFPIMTISLAGVSNEHKKIETYAEVTNIAAGVKKKAKATPGSCMVMDQRND